MVATGTDKGKNAGRESIAVFELYGHSIKLLKMKGCWGDAGGSLTC